MFYESLVKEIAPFNETLIYSNNLGDIESTLRFPEAPKLLLLFKDTDKAMSNLFNKV